MVEPYKCYTFYRWWYTHMYCTVLFSNIWIIPIKEPKSLGLPSNNFIQDIEWCQLDSSTVVQWRNLFFEVSLNTYNMTDYIEGVIKGM